MWRPGIGYVGLSPAAAAVDQLRRKLAGDRYRCWISDNEHRRRGGQGTWDMELETEKKASKKKEKKVEKLRWVGCV